MARRRRTLATLRHFRVGIVPSAAGDGARRVAMTAAAATAPRAATTLPAAPVFGATARILVWLVLGRFTVALRARRV